MAQRAAVIVGCALLMLVRVASAEEKSDQDQLQGTWQVLELVGDGKPLPAELIAQFKIIFTGDKLTFVLGGLEIAGDGPPEIQFKLDPSTKPGNIELTLLTGEKKGQTVKGIYLLEGDSFKMCAPEKADQARPTEFSSKEGSHHGLMVLQRVKEKEGVAK